MIYRLGIDLGGTNIAVGVVDENFSIIAKHSVKTNAPCENERLLCNVENACRVVIAKAGLKNSDIQSIGIGSPGLISSIEGVIVQTGNLKVRNLPICNELKKRLDVANAYIENDANAATYGEFVAGAGKGTKSFAVVTLGTGVGVGVIIDQKIFSCRNNKGGEIGHSTVVVGGEKCQCGRIGCLEAYASATALVRQTKAAMEKDRDSLMWQIAGEISAVDGRTAFEAMKKGDQTATLVIKQYIEYLAVAYLNVDAAYKLDAICIGGGISGEGQLLVDLVYEYIEKTEQRGADASLCVAKLGNDAGIIGAAYLDKLF